jgi:hypothetical protein
MFENWLNEIGKKTKVGMCIASCFSSNRPFGITETTFLLSRLECLNFCRLWLSTGFSYGHSYSRRSSGNLWLLDATPVDGRFGNLQPDWLAAF